MRRALLLGITTLFLIALFAPGSAAAQDEWQTITLGEITFQLPPEWLRLEEVIGLSDQEMAWYLGEIAQPDLYLLLALGEGLAGYLDMFTMQGEDVQIQSDETIAFLAREARKVVAFNRGTDQYGVFIALKTPGEAGLEMFLMTGTSAATYETYQPLIEKILATFTLQTEAQ
ncbi:MAG TPA: hypothetical protein VLH40_03080 [Atribacteraceae bacterium]|nr:hypothetical protein [Atribacteraceae bacterium]